MNTKTDAKRIADAFRQMQLAAMTINEVLFDNEALNESVPTNWPLQWSADEFAAKCEAMRWHYEALTRES